MEIEISQAIKTFFSNTSLRMVFCEAIANSLDANAKNIYINISIEDFNTPSSLVLKINDDGHGFRSDGLDRFSKLLKPKDALHKGIGRLVFLEYFDKVNIESHWDNTKIEFIFDENFDSSLMIPYETTEKSSYSKFEFSKFKKSKIKSYNDLIPLALKNEIIKEFLPKFLEFKEHGRHFKIEISLETNQENEQKSFFNNTIIITEEDIPKTEKTSFTYRQLTDDILINIDYFVHSNTGKPSALDTYLNIDKRCIPFSLLSNKTIR